MYPSRITYARLNAKKSAASDACDAYIPMLRVRVSVVADASAIYI